MITISIVEATRPEQLGEAAGRLADDAALLDDVASAERHVLNTVMTWWHGAAAETTVGHGYAEVVRQQTLSTRLTLMHRALSSAGTNLGALRSEIIAAKQQVTVLGGTVADDGTVRPPAKPRGPVHLLTPAVCEGYTTCFTAMLTQFARVDARAARDLLEA